MKNKKQKKLERIKNKEISPERAKAILGALKDFNPELWKTLIELASKKYKLENYR